MADTFAETRLNTYDLQSSKYIKSNLYSNYRRDEGLLAMAVMGPADTVPVVIRVHAPIAFRHVDFEYVREGAPPVYPAQADTESGDVILTSELEFPAPPDSGSLLVFGCRGHYDFVQAETVRGTEATYPIDRHPYFSQIDMLGQVDRYTVPHDSQCGHGNYNTDVMDGRFFGSYGILG